MPSGKSCLRTLCVVDVLFVLAAGFLFVCAGLAEGAQQSPLLSSTATGRLLAAPHDGIPAQEFESALRAAGANALRRIEGIDIVLFAVPPGNEQAAASILSNNPSVRFVESDVLLRPPQQGAATFSVEWRPGEGQLPVRPTGDPTLEELRTGDGNPISIVETVWASDVVAALARAAISGPYAVQLTLEGATRSAAIEAAAAEFRAQGGTLIVTSSAPRAPVRETTALADPSLASGVAGGQTLKRSPRACNRSNPTLAMTPVQTSGVTAGTTVAFQVSVKNNDAKNCDASTFDLGKSLPSGWTSAFTTLSMALSPGATGSTTLSVTSPSGTPSGSDTIMATATNRSATAFQGSASAKYVVATSTTSSPATVPGTPTIGTATSGNAQAAVTFTPPASNGGSTITGYKVTSSPGAVTANGSGSPITITGLVNGTSYTFTVQAINGVGASSPSAPSNPVTPATVPGAPTIGTASGGNAQATVAFTPPASNGGSAITMYTVVSNPGNITASAPSSPIVVTGLSNGTAYTFTAQAINAVGASASSAASNAVTPGGTTTAGTSYSTSFPYTENPLSESGRWVDGNSTGLDWQNVASSPGFAYIPVGNPSGYDDATAILTGTWGPDQYVRAVVRKPTVDPVYAQEIEIRLRSTMTAHRSTGYEVLGGTQIVRWNGALGDFTVLADEGPYGSLKDGDVFAASIVGNVITVYINGVKVNRAVDSTFTSGNPGIGFFSRNPSPAPFGFSSFSASNSAIVP